MFMKKAVYAGSFDPVTNGHLWIIQQAATLFDSLVIAIGENFEKRYNLSLQDRIDLLKAVTKEFPNIEINISDNVLSTVKYPIFRHKVFHTGFA
jgi:pantetheine-phosphate adenylyltransferase